MCLSCQYFPHAFCTCWWKPVTNWSSSSSTSSDSLFSIAKEYVSSTMATMHRLGTINSIGITASWPYINPNGVYLVNFFLVVLYAHNTAVILKSQSSQITLQTFVNACSMILLNASTMPFSRGWYKVLFWWWIWNSSVNVAIVLFTKWFPLSLISIMGHPNLVTTFSNKNHSIVSMFQSLVGSSSSHPVK